MVSVEEGSVCGLI